MPLLTLDRVRDAAGDPQTIGERAGLSDHETAEALRDGKLTSPQRYGDFWLFDMRITGTGMAWRESIEEWAHRNPDTWLTPEFVERAGHLNVIFLHPPTSGLNSEEYRERSIGNMQLAYVKGDEVWGVAKIFDADAAALMQTTHRSTSPGVTPPKGSTPLLLEQGTEALDMGTEAQSTKVLDEGLPLILDHLAVCEAGVWDKDGPPDGIRLDALSRKDPTVADKTEAEIEKERADAATVRADAAEGKLAEIEKADKAKNDAAIDSDREALEAAEKGKADKKKADARKDWETKNDSESDEDFEKRADSRMDGESDEDYDDRKKDRKSKKDAAAAAKTPVDADRGTEIKDSKALRAELDSTKAALSATNARLDAMTAQPSIADSNEIAQAWGRWDSLYQMHGEQTPVAYPGEKPRAYLRRLADGMRKFTKGFANYAFHDSQQATDFGLVADAIFAEAMVTAKNPIVTDGRRATREIVTHPHGKTRTEFIGDSRDFFAPFMPPMKFSVKSITRPTGNVYGK